MIRNSPKHIQSADDLNRLEEIVADKRNAKRADAKKHRRNRHYQKQFIKNALKDGKINLSDSSEAE